MTDRTFVVATRKSELALAQCRAYLKQLEAKAPGVRFEELHVVTTGDKITDRPLSEVGGKGLFLKEIEEALFDGRADFAVHSLKDVPPELHPELTLGCIPVREDARDAVVTFDGRSLFELGPGAKLGTSSLRRALQIHLLRPDLEIVSIRGNVGTRIRKVRERQVDATILAQAGANRLGVTHELAHTLSVEECLPAVGQGALAIEHRSDNRDVAELISLLNDNETDLATAAERGVLAAVEGDCKTPVAAYAVREGHELWLRALLARPDQTGLVRLWARKNFPASAEEAAALGRELGLELRAKLSATA
jgi:hydroxymethylbilane synthase